MLVAPSSDELLVVRAPWVELKKILQTQYWPIHTLRKKNSVLLKLKNNNTNKQEADVEFQDCELKHK